MKLRIAYLILAHRYPNHFGRLLRALDSPNATFFIHVDKKQSIKPFLRATEEDQLQSEVIFTKSRVRVYWGEGSMVQATLNLLAEALEKCPEGDYFCLLSGDSYPLQPPDYIEQFFLKNKGTEFIDVHDKHQQDQNRGLIKRMNQRVIPGKYRNRVVSSLIEAFNQLTSSKDLEQSSNINLGNFSILRDCRSLLKDLELYAGTQWWALTNSGCRYVVDFVEKNPNLAWLFKTAMIPDEIFFQTIICNSPFKSRISPSITIRYRQGSGNHAGDIITDINCLNQLRGIRENDGPIGDKNQEIILARKFSDGSKPVTDLIGKLWSGEPIEKIGSNLQRLDGIGTH